MIILDTNVVSALMRPEENPLALEWLDQQLRLSIWTTAVTVLEVRFGLLRLPHGRRRIGLSERFESFVNASIGGRILPFDREAAEQSAAISAFRQSAGRTVEFSDTQIAGIVLSRNATLATRNVKHFSDLAIPLVNPWTD
jgi:predicted nucleic acid-binding protein